MAEDLLLDNEKNLVLAKKYGVPYILIDDTYEIDF